MIGAVLVALLFAQTQDLPTALPLTITGAETKTLDPLLR